MIGCNLSRFCLMIGEQPVDHPLKAVQAPAAEARAQDAADRGAGRAGDLQPEHRRRRQDRHPACFRRSACGRSTAGMYLGTGDAVITKDPETGRINVGTYRMMIKGPREIGVYTSPGKDATIDRDKWWKMGKPMPIAAAYGIDPLLFLVGATSLPKTEMRVRLLFRHQWRADRAVHLATSPDCRCRRTPRSSSRAISIPTRPLPKGRSASSPAITAGRAARRPTCGSSACATATIRRLTCALMADGAVERMRAVLGGAALCRHLGRSAKARRAGHPGRVVDPGGGRLGHDGGVDQADVCRTCAAGDGAGGAMHGRRLFRKIRHRRGRGHRPDQRRPGAVGDGDAFAAGAVDRHPARDLEHLSSIPA